MSDFVVVTACYSFVSKNNLAFNALLSNADDSVHSLLFMREGHIRDVFRVSVLMFLEARHLFHGFIYTIYLKKKGFSRVCQT